MKAVPFDIQIRLAGLPKPVPEYRFARPRRFAFDLAFIDEFVAVEQEGGFFGRGKKCPLCGRRRVAGHSSIERLLSDLAKYNLANEMGWRVFRVTPAMVRDGSAIGLLRRVLKKE